MPYAPRTMARLASLTLAALCAALPAAAATVTPYDTGTVGKNFSSGPISVSHDPGNTSATIGISAGIPPDATQFSAYALFTLPADLQAPVAASLQFTFTCFTSCAASNPVRLNDLTSPASAFAVSYNASTSAQALALFADVSGGVAYGSGSAPAGATVLTINLGAPALAAMTAAGSGGFFGIGFSDNLASSIVWPGYDVGTVSGITNLQLQITSVPEPGSVAMLAAGLAALTLRRRAGA